jgi:hypothetical protein
MLLKFYELNVMTYDLRASVQNRWMLSGALKIYDFASAVIGTTAVIKTASRDPV